jgi:hypothetical protein
MLSAKIPEATTVTVFGLAPWAERQHMGLLLFKVATLVTMYPPYAKESR